MTNPAERGINLAVPFEKSIFPHKNPDLNPFDRLSDIFDEGYGQLREHY